MSGDEYHHTHKADSISSSVHDLFATEDKIKPLEIILIMRKMQTIKWMSIHHPSNVTTMGDNKERRVVDAYTVFFVFVVCLIFCWPFSFTSFSS